MRAGSVVQASASCSERPSRSTRAVSVTPKTVRMITSSVIACIVGHAASGSPAGQRSISRAATSVIVSS